MQITATLCEERSSDAEKLCWVQSGAELQSGKGGRFPQHTGGPEQSL